MSEDEVQRYRKMWGEVLITAIRDALWMVAPTAHMGGGGATSLDRQRARSWFRSMDFPTVCALAGFEPEFIHGHVVKLFDAPPERQRAFLSGLGLGGKFDHAAMQRGMTRLHASAAKHREAA